MDYLPGVGSNKLTNWNVATFFMGTMLICTYLYWFLSKQKVNLPPGPWSLPFIGYYPLFKEDVTIVNKRLYETYGNILSFCLGPFRVVVLNDYQIVKEAFENPVLQDRPPLFFEFFPGGLGFGVQNGEEWKQQRRFTVKTLNDMGLGTTEWQENIIIEIKDFIDVLEKQEGRPIDVSPIIAAAISNIMISIVLGERFVVGDPKREIVDNGVQAIIRTFSNTSSVLMVFAKTMKFLCKHGFTKHAADYQKMLAFNNLIHSVIDARVKTKDKDADELFPDKYLNEMERMKNKNAPSFYSGENLAGVVKSIVIGGSDTSKITVMWLILAVADNKDVQKKMQDEIDEVLGKEGKVTWAERKFLPYTNAALLEVLRWKVPGPLGVMHRAAEDTKIAGYDIPKGTSIASNINLIHYNEQFWEDPIAFKPERFLNEDGTKVISRVDNYLPFSIGKRSCPGEQIAYIEIFLFIVYILQRFTILPTEGSQIDLSGLCSVQAQPNQQNLRFVLRN